MNIKINSHIKIISLAACLFSGLCVAADTGESQVSRAVQAADLLPDDSVNAQINGATIRKGTMGACLANAELLESGKLSAQQKAQVLDVIREQMKSMVAVGAAKHLAWRNPELQEIFVDLEKKHSGL